MECYKVQRVLPGYCDDALPQAQSQDVRSHLVNCPQCANQSKRYERVRSALRALPAVAPPAYLLTSLRVVASRERARRLLAPKLPFFLAGWLTRIRREASGMMRPFALPMAGGLASALILFALVAPGFAVPARSNIADVPTVLSTEATLLGMGPFGFNGDNITIDVSVDSRGSVTGYSSPNGEQEWLNDPAVRRSVENVLIFAQISPGTTFGRPVSGTVRIMLRRSWIDVKG
jgi:Putative zinc-finger